MNGNYQNYGQTGLWVGEVNKDCSNLTGNMAVEAKKICASIYNIGFGDYSGEPNTANGNKFAIAVHEYTAGPTWLPYKGARTDMYSITLVLNSGKGYCFSNIGVYEGNDLWNGNHSPCLYWVTP